MGDVSHLWESCCDLLKDQVTAGVWMSTFQGLDPVEVTSQQLVLAVPSHIVADRIQRRYLEIIDDAVTDVHGSSLELVLQVIPAAEHVDHQPVAPVPSQPKSPRLEFGEQSEPAQDDFGQAGPGRNGSDLDALYTFDDFVIGQSNRFAFAASMAVAETPGRAYNPLFIYGDAGLGKTHLLQSIRTYVTENYPGKTVRYVSTESFLNDFIECIRLKTMNEFKRRYRELDVLLVDDIQFIEGAERFQEEFFHTFNELHARRSQIVLTSDRSPDGIGTLEHRLRSRFKMGLITDIQPPDVETRLAILRKKAERGPITVPDDVLLFIATNIADNIRELEGALTRVTAYANLYERELGVSLAEQVLSDILGESARISPQAILDKVAERYGFSIEEITGKSRRRPLVIARQVAMYVVRELTDLSYPAIARQFGDRDHTTVMHAVSKIEALMVERKAIFQQVQALLQELRKGAA